MINFDQYIDEDQKREIAQRAFYDSVRFTFDNRDRDFILYYFSQEYVLNLVNDILGQDHKDLIAAKVASAINELSVWQIFRDRCSAVQEGVANKYLREAAAEQKQAIYDRVAQIVDKEAASYFKDAISDVVNNYVTENLFRSDKNDT